MPIRTYDLTEGHTDIEIQLDGYYNESLLLQHAQSRTTHGVIGQIVGTEDSQTLLNKTLVSPIINIGISGTAIETNVTLSSDSNTLIPSVHAVKTYIDAHAGTIVLPFSRIAFGSDLNILTSDASLVWNNVVKQLEIPNLKLASKTLNGTQAGRLEFNGSSLYFSVSDTSRQKVLLEQFEDGQNIVLGSSTGTQFGTSSTQKLSFFGVAPVTQRGPYNIANYATRRDLDAKDLNLDQIGDILGTIVEDLRSVGLFG